MEEKAYRQEVLRAPFVQIQLILFQDFAYRASSS
jgi:hypothetical protein